MKNRAPLPEPLPAEPRPAGPARNPGGFALAAIAYPSVQVLRFATKVVLAWFVAPSEFGEIALAGVLAFAGAHIAALGLDTAVVSASAVSRDNLMRLQRVLAGTGAGAALLVAGGGLLSEGSGRYPHLGVFLLLLAPRVLLANFAVLPTALLVRDGRYRDLFILDIGGGAAFATATIAAAALGAGPLSLVAGWYAESLLLVAISSLFVRRRSPVLAPDSGGDDPKGLLELGRRVGLAGLLGYGGERFDSLLVAGILGRAALGAYEMALHFSQMLVQHATSFTDRWFFPYLAARLRGAPERRPDWVEFLGHAAILLLPVHIALAFLAPELVRWILDPAWSDAGPVLGALALSAGIRCMGLVPLGALKAAGQGGAVLKIAALEAVAVGACVSTMAPMGLVAVAWGVLAARAVAAGASLLAALGATGVGWRTFRDCTAPAAGIVAAWTLAFAAADALAARAPSVPRLAILPPLAAALWIGIRWLLDRPRLSAEADLLRGELRALLKSGRR